MRLTFDFFVIYEFKNHKTESESECEPIVDIFGIALKDNDCKQSDTLWDLRWQFRFMVLQIQNEWHKPSLQDQQKRKQLVCSDHFFTIINYFLSFLDMDLHFFQRSLAWTIKLGLAIVKIFNVFKYAVAVGLDPVFSNINFDLNDMYCCNAEKLWGIWAFKKRF